MKKNLKTLLFCISIPLLTGALSALLSRNGMETFQNLNKPPLSPPGYLFPVVWTILYILMGIASYFIITSNAPEKKIEQALTLYCLQLLVNFWWSIFFFRFEWYFFSFLWLLLLWILIYGTIRAFYPTSKIAGYLMIPYLLWVTFAGYLNFFIFLLN